MRASETGSVIDGGHALEASMVLGLAVIAACVHSVNQKRSLNRAEALLKVARGMVTDLLITMSDGYLLIWDDGSVVAADPKAEDLLNTEGSSNMSEIQAHLRKDSGTVQGLCKLRLTRGAHRFDVEAYTLAQPLPPEGIQLVLSKGMPAPAPSDTHCFHLCVLRINQAEQAAQAHFVEHSTSLNSCRLEASRYSGSVCQSTLESVTQTQLEISSALAGGAAIPGSTWSAVPAVGIGIGGYVKVNMVGHGGQGTVYQVKGINGTFYAQKDISLKGQLWHRDFPKRLRNADREVRALKSLAWAAPVVVPIVDAWIETNFEKACIVMEWVPVTLTEVFRQLRAQGSQLALQEVCSMLAQMAMGVAAIHKASIIHRDIKPANVLLDESRTHCKIADLGVSRSVFLNIEDSANSADRKDKDPDLKSQVSRLSSEAPCQSNLSDQRSSLLSGLTVRPGTNDYASPEALQGGQYGFPLDIFSLGAVTVEMLTLQAPPTLPMGDTEPVLPSFCRELLVPERHHGTEAEIRRLAIQMLSKNPEYRPSAQEILRKPCVKKPVSKLFQKYPRLQEELGGV